MSERLGLQKLLGLELFRRIRNNAGQVHELRTLFWECTLRCNQNCLHCGSDCKQTAGIPDMPTADFLKVIDSITPHVDPHHVMVIFTGGEALVRDDLETCGLALYQRGYPWGIVSNGLLLSRKRLDSLMKAGLHAATISLDGFEEPHNWLRHHPKSFAGASEAIKLLAEVHDDVLWDVVTCVNRRNYDSLEEFKTYLIGLGVRSWRIFTIFPVGRAKEHPDLQLTREQFRGVMDFIKRTRKEGRIDLSYGCEGFLGSYETEVRDTFYHCTAGVNVASVLADGSISGCPSIRPDYHQGNIYTDTFWEVWEHGFQLYRNREWMRKGECADCKMFRWCEGNGMHLRDAAGDLLFCHYNRLRRSFSRK